MRVLVGCERFCRVRDAFLRAGHEAMSCDIEEDVLEDFGGPHWQGDVLEIIDADPRNDKPWDMGIFFPPCTFLSSSGLHWNKRRPDRALKTEESLVFVERLLRAPIKRIALENPRGCITTRLAHVIRELGYVRQSIQPYDFGEDASKETVLLLKNLPPLVPTKRINGRMVMWKGRLVERWSNQTDSGQNRLGPSETRAAERGKTYPGIADAMAAQWGDLHEGQERQGRRRKETLMPGRVSE